MSNPIDAIESFCNANALPFDNRTRERFATYLALLQSFNEGSNLIGPLKETEIVDVLLIDSLRAAVTKPPTGHIIDVGTGAGLPGIPLRIVFDDSPITLVEPRRKRATFLKIAATRLGLKNVIIENKRVEEIPPGQFDYVISKAFQPPLDWIETANSLSKAGATIVCLTRPYEFDALNARATELGLTLSGQATHQPADLEPRAVYTFQKP